MNLAGHCSTTISADAESRPAMAQSRVLPGFRATTSPRDDTDAMVGSAIRYDNAAGTGRPLWSTTFASGCQRAPIQVRRKPTGIWMRWAVATLAKDDTAATVMDARSKARYLISR